MDPDSATASRNTGAGPSSRALGDGVDIDVCFGMILLNKLDATTLDDVPKSKHSQRIAIEGRGNMLLIHDLNGDRCYGLVDLEAGTVLAKLNRDFGVVITGTLSAALQLSVTLFGLSGHAAVVGEALTNSNLWLQQPDKFQFAVPYSNPQSLSKPGTYFPAGSLNSALLYLDKAAKGRVQEILDKSSGPESFTELRPSSRIKSALLEHQKKALAMMIEKEKGLLIDNDFPSLWNVVEDSGDSKNTRFVNVVTERVQSKPPETCLGGILADDMGLGKSLSTLALITTSNDLSRQEATSSTCSTPTLLVVPLATLSNWEKEINKHFYPDSITYLVYHGSKRKGFAQDLCQYEVVFTTYDTLKEEISTRDSPLFRDTYWNRVVLDEAHFIKNKSSKRFKAIKELRATHRWCLTGTPIQNHIDDFGALVDFLQVHPFNNALFFRQIISLPVNKGEEDGFVKLARLFRAISLRRVKTATTKELNLRSRREVVERVSLDKDEQQIYNMVKKTASRAIDAGSPIQSILQVILKLRQISNHGRALLSKLDIDWLDKAAQLDILDEKRDGVESQVCENCLLTDEFTSTGVVTLRCLHQICTFCCGLSKEDSSTAGVYRCPVCDPEQPDEANESEEQHIDRPTDLAPSPTSPIYQPSSKVKALLRNLMPDQTIISPNDSNHTHCKSWKKMLDLIQLALQAHDFKFVRVDGSKTRSERDEAIKTFRDDEACNLLLATIGSAGVGVDLSMASRVHIMEPQWNPMAERQALDRVYRIGQNNDVVSFIYVATGVGSIDEYMLTVQQRKLHLIEASFGSVESKRSALLQSLREHLYGKVESPSAKDS